MSRGLNAPCLSHNLSGGMQQGVELHHLVGEVWLPSSHVCTLTYIHCFRSLRLEFSNTWRLKDSRMLASGAECSSEQACARGCIFPPVYLKVVLHPPLNTTCGLLQSHDNVLSADENRRAIAACNGRKSMSSLCELESYKDCSPTQLTHRPPSHMCRRRK